MIVFQDSITQTVVNYPWAQ